MLNITELEIEAFVQHLQAGYRRTFGGLEPEYPEIIAWAGSMALENIANSDALYHDVVTEPERWNEPAFAEWLEAVSLDSGAIERDQARQLRRAVRAAIKLQRFWAEADASRRRSEPSWRARVDVALGVPAWRPSLELAMIDQAASSAGSKLSSRGFSPTDNSFIARSLSFSFSRISLYRAITLSTSFC